MFCSVLQSASLNCFSNQTQLYAMYFFVFYPFEEANRKSCHEVMAVCFRSTVQFPIFQPHMFAVYMVCFNYSSDFQREKEKA